jgi:hypothetical protein
MAGMQKSKPEALTQIKSNREGPSFRKYGV